MKNSLLILLAIVVFIATWTDAAKILLIIPFGATSHHIFINAITEELASRGHEITFYTSLATGKKIPNIKEIPLNNSMSQFIKSFDINMIRAFAKTPIFGPPGFFFMGLEISNRGLDDPSLAELIQSDEKFDLVILETHFGQEAFLGFGYKFQAPVISINTFSTHLAIDEYIGNSFGVSYIPSAELRCTEKMSFLERAHNSLRIFIALTVNYLYYLPKQESIMRKYFNYPGSENIPPLTTLLQNVSLVIVNSQPSVDFVRPSVPNVISAGGAHISPNRTPLPKDLKEYMDNSKNGVIYFSLGTVVPIEQLQVEVIDAFKNAFGKLKQNVLWKIPLDTLPGLPKNVKLSKWLPQNEILAHPNCLAFITHGGLLSQQEAVYFGVPLIGIPFFADQYLNIIRAADRGFAIKLYENNITESSVLWAVNEIVSNPSYKKNIQKYSKIFHDNPMPPRKAAAYWVEYVLRHKGAPHLRSEGSRLPYYKYLLLDVVGFMILVSALVIFIVYKLIKFVFRKLFCKQCKLKNVPTNKKKN